MLLADLIGVLDTIARAVLVLEKTGCWLLLLAGCSSRGRVAGGEDLLHVWLLAAGSRGYALHLGHSMYLLRRVRLVEVRDRVRALLRRLQQGLHRLANVVLVTFNLLIIVNVVNIFNRLTFILFKLIQIGCWRNLSVLTLIQLKGLPILLLASLLYCRLLLLGSSQLTASLKSRRPRW